MSVHKNPYRRQYAVLSGIVPNTKYPFKPRYFWQEQYPTGAIRRWPYRPHQARGKTYPVHSNGART